MARVWLGGRGSGFAFSPKSSRSLFLLQFIIVSAEWVMRQISQLQEVATCHSLGGYRCGVKRRGRGMAGEALIFSPPKASDYPPVHPPLQQLIFAVTQRSSSRAYRPGLSFPPARSEVVPSPPISLHTCHQLRPLAVTLRPRNELPFINDVNLRSAACIKWDKWVIPKGHAHGMHPVILLNHFWIFFYLINEMLRMVH